jgi:hypothetical protein
MDEIFIELQIALEEGSDLDLKNEDCHRFNEYLDNQLSEIDQLKADKMRMIIDKAKMTCEIDELKGQQWISVDNANIVEHMNYLCRYNDCRPFVASYKDGYFMDLDQILYVTHICIIPPRV